MYFSGCLVIFFILNQILMNVMQAYSGDPDQTPRFVASDLGLHCLHIPNKYMGHKLNVVSSHQNQLLLSLYLLVSSADNFCKQF